MRNVWDLTSDELSTLAARSSAATRAAHELMAPIFAEQTFLLEATDEEIRAALSPGDADYVIAGRQHDSEPLAFENSEALPPSSAAKDSSAAGRRVSEAATGWLQQANHLVAAILGLVNGMPQPLTVRAASGGSASRQRELAMRHAGHPADKLVVFHFSRPIREATLVLGNELIFSSHDLEADAPIEISIEDIVRNPADPAAKWEFVDGLAWQIDWKDS
jgi:hypothetical protein